MCLPCFLLSLRAAALPPSKPSRLPPKRRTIPPGLSLIHIYDMGHKLGILQAICEVALDHPEVGAGFRAYLKELAKTL